MVYPFQIFLKNFYQSNLVKPLNILIKKFIGSEKFGHFWQVNWIKSGGFTTPLRMRLYLELDFYKKSVKSVKKFDLLEYNSGETLNLILKTFHHFIKFKSDYLEMFEDLKERKKTGAEIYFHWKNRVRVLYIHYINKNKIKKVRTFYFYLKPKNIIR